MKSIHSLFITGSLFLFFACGITACGHETGDNEPVYNTNSGAAKPPAAAVNTTRGKEVYTQRCASCHGAAGNMRHENAANLQMTHLDSLGMAQTITNGRNLMPMFSGAINDTDMGQVITYVRTLRKY